MSSALKAELDNFDEAAKAIRRAMPRLTATIISRFRKELPAAGADLTDIEDITLADHSSTLIAEVATILTTKSNTQAQDAPVRERERQREMVMADGRTIYSVLGELHGRQRRKLKWTERAIRLEYNILIAELGKVAGRAANGDEDREVTGEISRILIDSRDHALKTFCTPAKQTR